MMLQLFVTVALAGGGQADEDLSPLCAFILIFGAIGVMALGLTGRRP